MHDPLDINNRRARDRVLINQVAMQGRSLMLVTLATVEDDAFCTSRRLLIVFFVFFSLLNLYPISLALFNGSCRPTGWHATLPVSLRLFWCLRVPCRVNCNAVHRVLIARIEKRFISDVLDIHSFPSGESTPVRDSFYRSQFQVDDASSALLLFDPKGAQPTTQTRELALSLIASK